MCEFVPKVFCTLIKVLEEDSYIKRRLARPRPSEHHSIAYLGLP